MDVAKLSSKGQLTIPQDIRNKLNLKQGDKVVFIEEADGRVYMTNASLAAFRKLTTVMHGEGAKQGLRSEADVNDFAREIRSSKPRS